MASDALKTQVEQLLQRADVTLNGDKPSDIQVHNDDLYARVLSQGSLGFGESYMDKWWDSPVLDECLTKILSANLQQYIRKNPKFLWRALIARLTNRQSKSRAFEVGEKHYDVGNDLYERMLDKRMVYTCGYWKNANTLDEAQEAKLDLVCKKINLQPGQTVLDIGCGWGSFAKFAAEKYGALVTGVTVSKEQIKLAKEKCAGLRVKFILQDYREITGQFDHVVSLGMFEHVGYKNYRTYMKIAHHVLKDDGLFLLHTIGGRKSVRTTDPWIEKYIFPNSMLPSAKQISTAIEGLFVMEDWHNFGADYDKTLMAWYNNFDSRWNEIKDKYGERCYRMWKFYLLSCAASFRTRRNHLWQIVLSKKGVPGGYNSIR